MSKLVWDQASQKTYETGVDRGVLYPIAANNTYNHGYAWNGITAVNESPSGAEANPLYADNIKYLNLISAEEFSASVEAYTYPSEFEQCDGSAEIAPGVVVGQQNRKVFGFSYRTVFGNDTDGNNHGYKLHLIYGCLAAPSEKGYSTISDSPEAITFSWEVSTTPVTVSGFKPTANITINSTKVSAANLESLENILYGTANADPRLPLPDEVASIFGGTAIDAVAVSSIVPADAATAISRTSTIVITFNNKIASEAVSVIASTGTLVAAAKAFDTTGKILTITPSASLTASTKYLVSISGVIDIYNQSLVSVVKSFTTGT